LVHNDDTGTLFIKNKSSLILYIIHNVNLHWRNIIVAHIKLTVVLRHAADIQAVIAWSSHLTIWLHAAIVSIQYRLLIFEIMLQFAVQLCLIALYQSKFRFASFTSQLTKKNEQFATTNCWRQVAFDFHIRSESTMSRIGKSSFISLSTYTCCGHSSDFSSWVPKFR
jgi:hypothetical protein